MDILLNGEKVDALSSMVHKSQSDFKGRQLVKSLREVIPRQMYDVAIQAAIGGKILAKAKKKGYKKVILGDETIPAESDVLDEAKSADKAQLLIQKLNNQIIIG